MTHNESVTAWLEQLKRGNSVAAAQLWKRYVEQLVRLARHRLGHAVRRAADEEDVVLSVFDAFLKGVGDHRFPKLDDRDDLWQILIMLTERKAIALRRHEKALKRGGGQVRGESVFQPQDQDAEGRPGFDQVADMEPTPAFAAEMAELLQRRLDNLKEPLLREIAVGKLQGYTHKELAQQLNIGLRTVERKLNLIRRKWSQEPC